MKPHPQRTRRDVCSLQHVLLRAFVGGTWVPEVGDPTDPRNDLLEVFQTLADEVRGSEDGLPRDVAARPRKAGDEPARNRIASSSEDDGKSPGRLLGGQGMGCGSGHDDINLERNQFGRESGEPLDLPLAISVFNDDVATFDVTEVTQTLTEGLVRMAVSGQLLLTHPGVGPLTALPTVLILGPVRRFPDSKHVVS